jgi:hypothetical protein
LDAPKTGSRAGERRKKRYNGCMIVALLFMRLLEVLFFAGLAGSAIVVIISFVEDAGELMGDD